MARGKHGVRAAIRRESAEVETTIADYQHKVARLTAENRDLRERLATRDRNATFTEKRLRAMLDEGSSDRVEALLREIQTVRADRDSAKKQIVAVLDELSEQGGVRFTLDGLHAFLRKTGLTLGSFATGGGAPSRHLRRLPANYLVDGRLPVGTQHAANIGPP